MMRQLLLPLQLRDDATFANFYPGGNLSIIEYLQNPKDNLLYLSGKPHTGLTHLLQALCHVKKHCLYLPLRNHAEFSPEMLKNSAQLELLALDDIDAVAGNKLWEEAIFHHFNQTQQQFIISSHILPGNLNIKLADLKSRLQSMLLLKTMPLSDEEKLKALQSRSKNRGFILSDEVGQFLLRHTPRDMAYLFQLLEKLDKISLEEKRRLTIPLVKKVLYA
jgi:DnaA-homolog protein